MSLLESMVMVDDVSDCRLVNYGFRVCSLTETDMFGKDLEYMFMYDIRTNVSIYGLYEMFRKLNAMKCNIADGEYELSNFIITRYCKTIPEYRDRILKNDKEMFFFYEPK